MTAKYTVHNMAI